MFYLILFFAFLFGLIIGSFLNCLIWRLHKSESMFNRSYCPKCHHNISWYDNIPVLSFIFLLGKCRHCRKKISLQYPLVEIITGILFTLAVIYNLKLAVLNSIDYFDLIINYKFLIIIIKYWFLISIMTIVFIYDMRWYLILDKIVLPASFILFFLNLLLGFSWLNLLTAGVIGASFFLAQFLISKGRWIGGGDIRLGLLMGIGLGSISYIILSIILGYFIGSIVGISLILAGKKKWGSKIPLGVFLSTSTIITLFYGQNIIDWYLGIL